MSQKCQIIKRSGMETGADKITGQRPRSLKDAERQRKRHTVRPRQTNDLQPSKT